MQSTDSRCGSVCLTMHHHHRHHHHHHHHHHPSSIIVCWNAAWLIDEMRSPDSRCMDDGMMHCHGFWWFLCISCCDTFCASRACVMHADPFDRSIWWGSRKSMTFSLPVSLAQLSPADDRTPHRFCASNPSANYNIHRSEIMLLGKRLSRLSSSNRSTSWQGPQSCLCLCYLDFASVHRIFTHTLSKQGKKKTFNTKLPKADGICVR
jgi:hypothetical protein